MKIFLKRLSFIAVTLVFVLSFSVKSVAQEHPEHPTKKHKEHPKKEHPEHPTKKLTKETLAKKIEIYVKKMSNDEGYFQVRDNEENKDLLLKLVKVHKERLSTIGKNVYFACADFKAKDGNIYDIDIFMEQTKKGLKATKVHVHKLNGEARYTWYEEEGIWKTRKVE